MRDIMEKLAAGTTDATGDSCGGRGILSITAVAPPPVGSSSGARDSGSGGPVSESKPDPVKQRIGGCASGRCSESPAAAEVGHDSSRNRDVDSGASAVREPDQFDQPGRRWEEAGSRLDLVGGEGSCQRATHFVEVVVGYKLGLHVHGERHKSRNDQRQRSRDCQDSWFYVNARYPASCTLTLTKYRLAGNVERGASNCVRSPPVPRCCKVGSGKPVEPSVQFSKSGRVLRS
jgi:hypothetical protein